MLPLGKPGRLIIVKFKTYLIELATNVKQYFHIIKYNSIKINYLTFTQIGSSFQFSGNPILSNFKVNSYSSSN